MSLKSRHPDYIKYYQAWSMLLDLYEGEQAVKLKGEDYLPSTPSMRIDGMGIGQPGWYAYNAYKLRAVVPDYIKNAVDNLVGIMHQKDATITLPKAMEYLLDNATDDGEDLNLLLRKINAQQLLTGRLGILAELPEDAVVGPPQFKLCLYCAHSIANWDDDFVIFDECEEELKDNFEWQIQEKYRVIKLIDGQYFFGEFEDENYNEDAMVQFTVFSRSVPFLPFTFINSIDLVDDVSVPPLLGLAYDCLKIYRGEADLRQSLFMQGQDTLILIGNVLNQNNIQGNNEPVRVGAGSVINMDFGGDAKFIGVNSGGLEAQRSTIAEDRKEAENKAGQLMARSLQPESGASLQTRIASQTATLHTIAKAGAVGLENALKQIAIMMNLNPDEVTVKPNLEFIKADFDPKKLIDFMTAKTMGAPVSTETIHNFMSDSGVTQFNFEQELETIAGEGV